MVSSIIRQDDFTIRNISNLLNAASPQLAALEMILGIGFFKEMKNYSFSSDTNLT